MRQKSYTSIEEAEASVLSRDFRRVFFVTGKKSFENSGAKGKFDELLGKSVGRFCDFETNPKLEDIRRGITLYRERKPDYVVAAGGGSVIDMAKLIIGLSGVDDAEDALINNRRSESNVSLLAVPTTSGSGSESTPYAVAYVDGVKYSFNHQESMPGEIVLDPTLTYSMNRSQAAAAGFDAFSQGVEAYWSIGATEESKVYSRKSIALCVENLEESINNSDRNARDSMMQAANFAGKAIAIARTTAPHAISYAMSSRFHVLHGHAVALTLGEIYEYNARVNGVTCSDPRGVDYVRDTMRELNEILGVGDEKEARDKINGLMGSVGLETRLSKIGVDLNVIVDEVNEQRLRNNPRKLGETNLRRILEMIS